MPGLANIQSSIGSTPVVVVSKSYCPYCRRAKVKLVISYIFISHLKSGAFQSILDSYGIDQSKIQIFEIENDPDMRQIQAYMGQITGGTTVRTFQNMTISCEILLNIF